MGDLTPAEYYRDPAVRARIRELCGATGSSPPTCAFVTPLCQGPLTRWETAEHFSPAALDQVIERGCDVARSMWDATSVLVDLDVDYFENTSGEALLRPGHAFFRLEPAFRTIQFELARLELPLLSIMTGRGYQFTGRMPLGAPVVGRLADIGARGTCRATTTGNRYAGTRRDRAFVGMGMVLEHFAHTILKRAASSSTVPIVVNGTEVGKGGIGRESVSIDLSYSGDLLESRHVRVAFGTYQTHLLGRTSLARTRALVFRHSLPYREVTDRFSDARTRANARPGACARRTTLDDPARCDWRYGTAR